jgi:hypothetical protein
MMNSRLGFTVDVVEVASGEVASVSEAEYAGAASRIDVTDSTSSAVWMTD